MVQYSLDHTFGALADPTRRGILARLGRGEAPLGTLAEGMSLTGLAKHVRVLEDAGLVTTRKVGRERLCRLAPHGLDEAAAYVDQYRRMLEARLDSLEAFLQGEDP
jgi:DNA-binding transcriptional ArsR family regulator